MPAAYQACDLVIARSGALTCAELAAVGKFAILIPLPIGNGEQSANALDLQDLGAAQVIDDNKFNADWLISNWDEIWRTSREYKPVSNIKFDASQIIGTTIISEVEK